MCSQLVTGYKGHIERRLNILDAAEVYMTSGGGGGSGGGGSTEMSPFSSVECDARAAGSVQLPHKPERNFCFSATKIVLVR